MAKIRRNDPCHCGSGKKYKNCHQNVEEQKKVLNNNLIIGGVALFLILLALGIYWKTQSTGDPSPGNAPAGKVWSPEHGHYHDIE